MPAPEDLFIQLHCDDIPDSRLQSLARDTASLLKSAHVGVPKAEDLVQIGTKGDPITIGNIVLTLIGSGGVAAALVQVLKAQVEKKSTLRFELTKNGQPLVLDASNLTPAMLASTERLLSTLLEK